MPSQSIGTRWSNSGVSSSPFRGDKEKSRLFRPETRPALTEKLRKILAMDDSQSGAARADS
jgi:hypothetical protein